MSHTRVLLLLTSPSRTHAGFLFSPGRLETGSLPIHLAAADLNADGQLDLLSADLFTDVLSVYLASTPGYALRSAVPTGDGPRSTAVGDDAVASSGHLVVQLGNGDGTFSTEVITPVSSGGPLCGFLAIGDLDGDGRPDVVGTNSSDNTVSVLLNRGVPPAELSGGRVAVETATVRWDSEAHAVRVFPNPIRSEGTITFRTSKPGPVRVQIFDTRGRLIRTLLEGSSAAGSETRVRVSPGAEGGKALANGLYFYRVETSDGSSTGRMMVLR